MPCRCDACVETNDLQSSGYCSFCAEKCFPKGIIGTRTVSLAMSPASRAALHAQARGIPATGFDPRRIARAAGNQIANAAIDAAKPLAKEAMKEGLKYIQKKLAGR